MDAEEFFRREATTLLAEFPDLTPEQIAEEVRKESYDGDPAIAEVVLSVGRRLRVPLAPEAEPVAGGDFDDDVPW